MSSVRPNISCRTVASEIVLGYPESNPFEADCPPYNLVPWSLQRARRNDTPEFIAATLAMAHKSGINPLSMWYGYNPLEVHEESIQNLELPLVSYRARPPPLARAILQEPLTFLTQISSRGASYIYEVRVGQDIRLLKVFPDNDSGEEEDRDDSGQGMACFWREVEAYAHLLHYGVDKTGVVPHCYGWLDLSEEDLDKIDALPASGPELQPLRRTRRAPKGVLLEYFEDAQVLSIDTVTHGLANTALKGLYSIHAAYVKHGDVSRHNILLLPNGRVVWIDFDHSVCASEQNTDLRPDRKSLLYELSRAWHLFYCVLLPDQRIGFTTLD